MLPHEFKAARRSLVLDERGAELYNRPKGSRVSQSLMGEILGVKNSRTIRKWEDGDNDISGPAIVIMKAISKVPEFRKWLGIAFNNEVEN